MTDSPKHIYTTLTEMLNTLKDFKFDGDFDLFSYNLGKHYFSLPIQKIDVDKNLENMVDRTIKHFAGGRKVKKNKEQYDALYNTIIQKRVPYDALYTLDLLKKGGVDEVKKHLDSKNDKELDMVMGELIDWYKTNRTDENRKELNKILKIFDKKIVRIRRVVTGLDEKRLVRFAFEGAFMLPSREDNERGIGYSKEYIEFYKQGSNKNKYKDNDYNFESSNIEQLISQSSNISKMKNQLRQAVIEQGMPPEIFKKLNICDAAHILYQKFGNKDKAKMFDSNGKFVSSLQFSFKSINQNCNDGLKKIFKEKFNKDEATKDLLARFLEVGGRPVTHHKFHIKDANALENVMDVDDIINYMYIIGEKNHYKIFHGLDYDKDGISERFVDTKDGKNGYCLVLFAGWRNSVYVEEPETMKDRVTYMTRALKDRKER